MNKKELISVIKSGRAIGDTTGRVLEVIGLCLQNPGIPIYFYDDNTNRRGMDPNKQYKTDYPSTRKMINEHFIPMIFDYLKILKLKGFIYNKSNRSLVYSIEKYIDELEKE